MVGEDPFSLAEFAGPHVVLVRRPYDRQTTGDAFMFRSALRSLAVQRSIVLFATSLASVTGLCARIRPGRHLSASWPSRSC